VGIATGYRLDGRGSILGKERYFSLVHSIQTGSGPTSLLSSGYRGFFPWGVKQPGHEADHSPPSSAKVKNGGAIPPFPIHLNGMVRN
jgi:hypothetical protein